MHGLYESYAGLEARVESRSANHRLSRLVTWAPTADCDWSVIGPPTQFFFVSDEQKCDYLSRASQSARGATKKSGNEDFSEKQIIIRHLGYTQIK